LSVQLTKSLRCIQNAQSSEGCLSLIFASKF